MISMRHRRLFGVDLDDFDSPAHVQDVWHFGQPHKPVTNLELEDISVYTRAHNLHVLEVARQARARAYHEQRFGQAIASKEIVDRLFRAFTRVPGERNIEVFAGTGWMAAHLQHAGVNITPVENRVQANPWTKLYDIDPVQEAALADNVLMLWPPDHVESQRVVMRMKKGALLFYFGHGKYTGLPTKGFWHHLARSHSLPNTTKALDRMQPKWNRNGLPQGEWIVLEKV